MTSMTPGGIAYDDTSEGEPAAQHALRTPRVHRGLPGRSSRSCDGAGRLVAGMAVRLCVPIYGREIGSSAGYRRPARWCSSLAKRTRPVVSLLVGKASRSSSAIWP